MVLGKVVPPLERGDDVNPEWTSAPAGWCLSGGGALAQDVVLREELYRPVARAVDADLCAGQQPIADLEADLRAAVDAKQIREQVPDIPLPEVPREAVCHPERPFARRHPQRRRQCQQCELRLHGIYDDIRIVALGLLRRCRRWRGILWQWGGTSRDDERKAQKKAADGQTRTAHVDLSEGNRGAAWRTAETEEMVG